jgi:hypothetical protein
MLAYQQNTSNQAHGTGNDANSTSDKCHNTNRSRKNFAQEINTFLLFGRIVTNNNA